MNRVLLILVALLLSFNVASAATFGPASPSGDGGDFTFGLGYHPYDARLDNGLKMDQDTAYAQLGYNFTNNIGMYVIGGGADTRFKTTGFDDGYRPFGGMGFKALLTGDSKPLGIGFFGQGLYFAPSEVENPAANSKTTLVDHFQVDGGLLLQVEWDNGILYGGPIGYLHALTSETETNGSLTAEDELEEKDNIGSVLGVNWRAGQDMFVELELQNKTKLTGAVNILIRF